MLCPKSVWGNQEFLAKYSFILLLLGKLKEDFDMKLFVVGPVPSTPVILQDELTSNFAL